MDRDEEQTTQQPLHDEGGEHRAAQPAEYDPLADLYDLEYVHDYDVEFWLSLAAREDGPVVEWGAGTGRIAASLARAGHDVTAVGLSERMVERGREKSADVEWVVGDMRTTRFGRRFGLAVCAFNSLLCLLSPEDVLAFVSTAHEHLQTGGLLGIEVSAFSPEELLDAEDDRTLQHDFTRETPDGWLDRFSVSSYDAASRIMEMKLFYELYSQDGSSLTRRAHDLSIRVTDREELLGLLRHAGFGVESVYGGFEREPYTAASDHLIVLARNG